MRVVFINTDKNGQNKQQWYCSQLYASSHILCGLVITELTLNTCWPVCKLSLPPDNAPIGSRPFGVRPFNCKTLSLSSLQSQHTFKGTPFQVHPLTLTSTPSNNYHIRITHITSHYQTSKLNKLPHCRLDRQNVHSQLTLIQLLKLKLLSELDEADIKLFKVFYPVTIAPTSNGHIRSFSHDGSHMTCYLPLSLYISSSSSSSSSVIVGVGKASIPTS